MDKENVAPVNHGMISSASTTATSAVGHGVRTGGRTALKTLLGFIIAGAVIGLIWSTVGFGFLGTALATEAGGVSIGGVLGATALGALGAGLIGIIPSIFAGGLGGFIGAGKGTVEGSRRVSEERGAYQMVRGQIQALQAQAAMTQQQPMIIAPSAANNNFPAQGSPMNQAGSHIQADSAMDMGMVNGQAMAAAR